MIKVREVLELENTIEFKSDVSDSKRLKYRANYGFVRSLCKIDVEDVKEAAEEFKDFENFVQVGIGGSALPATAALSFLGGIYSNYTSKKRYFVLDNIDPERIEFILNLNLEKTLFHVVSKSGSTIETIAQFSTIYKHLTKIFGNKAHKHFVFTTSDKGFLYEFAQKNNIKIFLIPDEVGGRYSVFTPVAVFPLAFFGYDVDGFIEGGKTAVRGYRNGFDLPNDFALFAVESYKEGKNMLVFFAYKDRLAKIGEWFRQLWAESLGKNGKGQTPIEAVGVTDQHSQLQLYQDGPSDKAFVFVDMPCKTDFVVDDQTIWPYKTGSLCKIMEIEKNATLKALKEKGLAVSELFLKRTDEFGLASLLMLLMIATVKAGEILGVDPFDQPGVEKSKKYAKEELKNG